jgi:hypothetical protein
MWEVPIYGKEAMERYALWDLANIEALIRDYEKNAPHKVRDYNGNYVEIDGPYGTIHILRQSNVRGCGQICFN